MPKITKVRDRLVKARARAAVLDSAQAPEWLIVRSRIVLHTRRDEPGARCPCCGSRWAHIIEEERGPELLIDTSQRRRWLRHETKDRATFDEIAAIAHPVDMPLRVPDIADAKTGVRPIDLLKDLDAMAHAVSGGNRSGKSTFGTDAWLPYRWLLRGGAGRMFRLLGPVRAQAHILANKLFGVEGDKPGSFPPVLVESLPTSRFAQEQTIRLVDGTEMQLTHAKSAGHLKGVSVQECARYALDRGHGMQASRGLYSHIGPACRHGRPAVSGLNPEKGALDGAHGDRDTGRGARQR
jgi:hypothetical protein